MAKETNTPDTGAAGTSTPDTLQLLPSDVSTSSTGQVTILKPEANALIAQGFKQFGDFFLHIGKLNLFCGNRNCPTNNGCSILA